jgi:hypothetical protein
MPLMDSEEFLTGLFPWLDSSPLRVGSNAGRDKEAVAKAFRNLRSVSKSIVCSSFQISRIDIINQQEDANATD